MRASGLDVVYMPGTPFETRALKNVDLEVEGGEVLGLVGATGSGKSTFLQAVAGLIEIAGGRLTYGETIDPGRLCTRVGMVFQMPEDQLFEKTVLDDVAFGPRQLGWPEDRVAASSRKALERVGLDPGAYGPRSPVTLSGGEKRRAAIAGILSMEPILLLLDEPTAGLDSAGRRRLAATMRDLNSEGATIVVVTHDLDLLADLATRIAVFQEGRVLVVGPPAEILADPDLLARAGLKAPLTVELLALLKKRGLAVRTGLVTVKDTIETVIEACGRQATRRRR